jgi:GR25 family glycosyltransferase involved in LPS biosynthesis
MTKLNIKNIPIYIINLAEHVDRYNLIHKDLSKYNFTQIHRFDAIKGKTHQIGCASSHREILSSNIDPPFIILEDDCLIMKDSDEICVPAESDAIYLGISRCSYHDNTGTILKSLYKLDQIMYQQSECEDLSYIYNMLSTHAILYLSKDYMKEVIKICNFYISINDHFDKGLAEIMKYNRVLAMNRPVFYQTSNIHATKLNLSDLPKKYYEYSK